MNIFLTDPDPRLCAINLDSKRVVKMALETAQLLSSAALSVDVVTGYKQTHVNHPCAVWARLSGSRFNWLLEHGLELCHEYAHRYGGKVHASRSIMLAAAPAADLLPVEPLAFDFNSSGFRTGDVFEDYKLCLVNKWRYLDTRRPVWEPRDRPSFARRLWATDFNNTEKQQ